METVRFDELELYPQILRAVEEMGFEEATPIQSPGDSHCDVGCGRDRTGTDGNGKDGVFWYSCAAESGCRQ